jgi:predicted nucleotide-binding protein
MLVKLWTNHVFASSSYTLDDLLLESAKADFAVFVVLGEDMTKSRGTESVSPRDNVVLELGIFMGALGRTRSLIVRPRGADLKIPSDLLGLNVIDYDATVPLEDLSSVLGPVCTEIRGVVSKHGPR